MKNECNYIESTIRGNYCTLECKECSNPEPNNNCTVIEDYFSYLSTMHKEVLDEEFFK